MGNVINQVAFPAPPKEYSKPFLDSREDLVKFKIKTGEQIFAVNLVNKDREANGYYVLYSHGNGEDVGLAIPYLEEVAHITKCHVFAYEYVGYSITEGSPSEHGVIDSINAAYTYLTVDLKVPKEKVFIFGRSIGSGPSVDLASRVGAWGAAGLILQSPLASGARAIFGPVTATVGTFMDIFKNIDKIDDVKVKTVIMHGEKDEVVNFQNGMDLFEKLDKRNLAYQPLWLAGKGHNDMPERKCLEHCRKFIDTRIQDQKLNPKPANQDALDALEEKKSPWWHFGAGSTTTEN